MLLSVTACGKSGYDPNYQPVNSVAGGAVPELPEGDPVPADSLPGDAPADSVPDVLPEDDSLPADEPAPAAVSVDNINVRPTPWADVTWTTFQCAYFTVEIPEGWTVDWNGNAEVLAWTAKAPEGTFAGVFNIDHMSFYKSQQTANMLGQEKYLENGTVEDYFKLLYADTTENFTVHNSCVPANYDQLQAMRSDKKIQDYQAMYATFHDKESDCDGEGIYSAVVMEAPDLVLTGGINYAMWEINGTLSQWAEPGRLVDWAPVLAHICQSFTYTDFYIQEWIDRFQTTWSGDSKSQVADTDPVMEAFEERMKSDTIIQEKYSDMIGEYERVYDTENDKIYRAYNGFLEDLGPDQNRFTSITDDQYADGYSGWIDKD